MNPKERKGKEMTKLSKLAFSEATVKMNSVEDAVAFLEKNLVTRNVRSILEKFSNGKDQKTLQRNLVDGLLMNHPDMKKDSVERRVRGWLDPNSLHTLKKEDAIEIAFILQLGMEEADEFVALISEEKLHWRSVDEIVFIFGLTHGLSYRECAAFLNQSEIQDVISKIQNLVPRKTIEEDSYTEFVKQDISKLHTVEELKQYLQENYERLGSFHNTAYDMFMEMIAKLESPEQMEEDLELYNEFDEENFLEKYTIRDILDEYLYKDIVLTAKQKAVKAKKKAKTAEKEKSLSKESQYTLTIIQKKVADSWPDEVSISRMKNRKADITRKALILLFLATDGDYAAYGYDEDLEEDEKEEIFEDILERLDDMLFFCGYSSLDPRNPFDWLILYCIYVDDLFDIDPKMEAILSKLFNISPEENDKED